MESYLLELSYVTTQGERDTIEVLFDGDRAEGYSDAFEVSVYADSAGIDVSASYGLIIEEFDIAINGVDVPHSFVYSEPTEVCGSICTSSFFDLQTDSIGELAPAVSEIADINEIIACTERSDSDGTINENLTIVARNENRTHALFIYEQEGFYAPGNYWENGGFFNPNFTIELHTGVNVGVNYCTDTMVDEDITEIFLPIDSAEVPEGIDIDETSVFSYGVGFPECEGCVPYAMVHLENFWFRSQEGNYAVIESIDYLQSDVTTINVD